MKKLLIAGGNLTLLVWGCPIRSREKVINKYLGKNVEQIGFVSYLENGIPELSMMGNELCINATIALASQLENKGKLKTSGISSDVAYKNTNGNTCIMLYLPYKKLGNIVLLPGIGYIFSQGKRIISKANLSKLARKYKKEAFGSIEYKNEQIFPCVFVMKTNSLFQETACGSGSISLNILSDTNMIIQPTGETIKVERNGNYFTVSAAVANISLSKQDKNDIFKEKVYG